MGKMFDVIMLTLTLMALGCLLMCIVDWTGMIFTKLFRKNVGETLLDWARLAEDK